MNSTKNEENRKRRTLISPSKVASTTETLTMNPQLAQILIAFVMSALFASVVSSLVYFFLRFLQNFSAEAFVTFTFLFLSGCGFAMLFGVLVTSFALYFLILCFCIFLFGFFGGIFHQKSNSFKQDPFFDFGLSFAAVLLSLFFNVILLPSLLNSFNASYSLIERSVSYLIFWIWIIAQSLTTPFLIWAWKNSRLRPGIDKHLED